MDLRMVRMVVCMFQESSNCSAWPDMWNTYLGSIVLHFVGTKDLVSIALQAEGQPFMRNVSGREQQDSGFTALPRDSRIVIQVPKALGVVGACDVMHR